MSDFDDAAKLLDDAERALAVGLPLLLRQVDATLALYREIPVAVDVFEIAGLHGAEDPHTEVLAWLLDPAESHGLRDLVLRRFLALVDDTSCQALARRPGALYAKVATQLTLEGGTPDMVVVIDGPPSVLLVVEAKIDAPLTLDAAGTPQTQRYIDAVEAITPKVLAERLRGASGNIWMPVFAFLRAGTTDPEPKVEPKERRYRVIEYPAVERVLARVAREMPRAAPARAIVQQYRTSILRAAAGGVDLAAQVERLRDVRDVLRGERSGYVVSRYLREGIGNLILEEVSDV